MTLGQELWKRRLNHFKAKADDKARPTEGLCQRDYLIYSLNCLKKTCTWHLHSSRLIQTMLEDWITMNYSHKYCAIQTSRIHILNSQIPQVHHVSHLRSTIDSVLVSCIQLSNIIHTKSPQMLRE